MGLALIITGSVIGYVFIGCVAYKVAERVCPPKEDDLKWGQIGVGVCWPIGIPVGIIYKFCKSILSGTDNVLDKIEMLPTILKQSKVRAQQKKRSKGELSITEEYSGGELSNTDT